MDRAFVRPIAVAAALHLLAALHGAASARPLTGRLPVAASATSALAVAPAAAHQRRAAGGGTGDADAADSREGKWLPFLGAHHLPPAYWAHKPKPVPWPGAAAGMGATPELGGAGAVEGGEVEEGEEAARERVRERRRRHRDRDRDSSYVGDGAESTRQEQLAMWASLLNPKGGGTPAAVAGWLPAPGIGETADSEPAKAAADTASVEGAEGEDEPSARQSYWGNNGN
ncbi:unnamed protein product [Urochloa decumbens]|uniref:Uncharacterized protein n=1 Tax=Urochloa decumbens TaxID=240449 RepID=A0ABC8YIN9_9POAL